mmetsp:Transcript_45791/g.121455  ORF Transcript_45791/g.121455 Transcript_45791/m.121455 type:complete len:80 (+) Transcript_45791:1377-1616(+)
MNGPRGQRACAEANSGPTTGTIETSEATCAAIIRGTITRATMAVNIKVLVVVHIQRTETVVIEMLRALSPTLRLLVLDV